jgi:signal transduction histidine kinase
MSCAGPGSPGRLVRACVCGLVLALAAVIGLLGGCASGPGADRGPGSAVQAQGWWKDSSGRAELADVQQVTDWTPFSGLTTFGFGPEPVWFRLRIRAGGVDGDAPKLRVLRVLPSFLDELTFHDPTTGRVLRAGRSIRPEAEMVSSINPSFPLPSTPQARDVYVRLESNTTRLVLMDVLPYAEAAYRNRLQEWLFAALIALSAVSALWAMTEWVSSRESVVGLFAVKQILATTWGLLAAGFARILIGHELPASTLTNAQTTLMPLAIASSIAFIAALLQGYGPPRAWIRLLGGLAAGFALLPLLQLFGLEREIRVIANVGLPVTFLCLFLTLASVVRWRKEQPLQLSPVFFYLCAYSLMLSVPALINLGSLDALSIPAEPGQGRGVGGSSGAISPWDILAVHASLVSLMLDGFMMRVLLMQRANAQKRAQRATELELQRSEEESKARRRLNEEQSRLFSMLAHELKTPLATLRLWAQAGPAGHPAMERAIADMNLIIERCVHTGQLAEQGLQPIAQDGDALAQTRAGVEAVRDPARVELTAPDCAAPIAVDMQMLSIVLVNLLDNAIKYSAPQSPVTVHLQGQSREGRAGWAWQISNLPGPAGLPDAGRLFEKYYRSPGARHQSGSGLGLFLVRGLLDLMEGTIQFEVREGRVVFEFWLPARAGSR